MKNNKFKYVVIAVVLLIPFIYSFFYLKAYWNPYGEGNIDNIPVAIVNSDEGDKGTKLVKSIKESKKLKLNEVSEDDAEEGLNNGDYYAVINIPKSFTKDMESASDTKKYHATITYSPNQKANFLASQIINSVVNAVEKNLDNEVNSAIVESLSENIEEVPGKLNTISNGFTELKDGTNKLNDGSNSLASGTNTLNYNYNKFNNGITDLNNGVIKLNDGANELSSGLKTAYDGSSQIKSAIDSKIEELKNDTSDALTEEQINAIGASSKAQVESQINEAQVKNTALYLIKQDATYQTIDSAINSIETNYINNNINTVEKCADLPVQQEVCIEALTKYPFLVQERQIMETVAQTTAYNTLVNFLPSTAESVAKNTASTVANIVKQEATNTSINSLTELTNNLQTLNSGLNKLYNGSLELSSGTHTLLSGSNTLYNSSSMIQTGIHTLNNGAQTLNNGMTTLNNSVSTAKDELDNNIDTTKESIKKVENLSEYSKEPVKVETKEVNKINSYGIAFSPLFLSIGLWVGSLMMFVVFYYDKAERFGVLGINSKNKVKQVLTYHALISISSLVLGMLSHILLDLEVTSIPLYYISLLLIGNAFMGIIELLIICFNDIGKFIALIILVLQLAAAGGTFPIETVTKGFRWMHPLLPMTYTVNLLKEALIKVQANLLTKNLIIVMVICIIFFVINILIARLKEEKQEVED